MASSKKSGNSRVDKGVNGRRSSKHKEGPVGEFSASCEPRHGTRVALPETVP